MASKHVDIAEAIKDSLNSASLAMDFVAERKYPGAVDRIDVSDVEVFVFPIGHAWTYIDRKPTTLHTYDVQVVVRSPLNVDSDEYDQDQVDLLLELMEDIEDHLRDNGQMSTATLTAGTNDPIFEPDKLDEHLFFAGLVFTYTIGRSA